MANPVSAKTTILIVSDNAGFRALARDVLAIEGYDVAAARDGLEALELLNRGLCRPDLIVSDVWLVRLNGLQLRRAVRGLPAVRDVPFLLLKGDGIMPDPWPGDEPGADDTLCAPFEVDDFLATVKSRLRRARGESDPA